LGLLAFAGSGGLFIIALAGVVADAGGARYSALIVPGLPCSTLPVCEGEGLGHCLEQSASRHSSNRNMQVSSQLALRAT
jgi:hypothetical protein